MALAKVTQLINLDPARLAEREVSLWHSKLYTLAG